MDMKEDVPERLAAISRHKNYLPTLPLEIREDIYKCMDTLLAEEKAFCDKKNKSTWRRS